MFQKFSMYPPNVSKIFNSNPLLLISVIEWKFKKLKILKKIEGNYVIS
jgi:hypothetical protein